MRADQLQGLLEARTRRPHAIIEAAARRRRPRSLFNEHGRLMVIPADHPARGSLRVGSDPFAMASRTEPLDALDDKVVIGSMNRGGLAGTVFEIDDRFTAYDAAALEAMGFEGGKMLLRIDPDDPATAATLEACAQTVSALAGQRLLAATTLPALILGGDVTGDQDAAFAGWSKALALPTVRGLVVGRALLFPPDGDVAAAVDTAVSLLEQGRVTR